MKEYSVTLTVRVQITARNEEQGEERAAMLEEAILFTGGTLKKPWFGDYEIETEVEVDE